MLAEALSRGHQVTGVSRHPEKLAAKPGLTAARGDTAAPEELAAVLAGHDAVARDQLLLHPEIAAAMRDELVGLLERPFVEQELDAFPRRHLSFFMLALAALGWLPPIAGAVTQEVIDLVTVLNAVRMTLPFGTLRDF